MTEEVKTFIDQLATGDNANAGEAFKTALRAKVATGLDAKRKEMANSMFTQQPEENGTPDTMVGVDVNAGEQNN